MGQRSSTLKRLAAVILIVSQGSQAAAALQSGGLFPWLRRGDPKIETFVFMQRAGLAVGKKRIGLLPFPAAREAEPVPPDFASSLLRALLEDRQVTEVRKPEQAPWVALPEWRRRELDEPEQVRSAVAWGRAQGLDLIVLGRTEALFRTARQGLTVKVSVRVLSAEDGRVVWYGRKRAEWIRLFPIEDCMLHLARSFVEEWPVEEMATAAKP